MKNNAKKAKKLLPLAVLLAAAALLGILLAVQLYGRGDRPAGLLRQ